MCNTVFSIAKEGSKSCLCAGSSRARGSKAVRRGAVPPAPPCRRSRVIASTWQLELPSLCTLAAAASVAAATPNYFALVAMSRRRRGAGGGGSSVRLGYSKSTQARHWCKAPQRHHCAAAAAAPHYFALEAAPPAPARRAAAAAAARTATIEQSSSTLYSFAMGTRTASNYDYYSTTYYVY